MHSLKLLALAACLAAGFARAAPAPQRHEVALDASAFSITKNVTAAAVIFQGKPALRVTDAAPPGTADADRLLALTAPRFKDGQIDLEIAGDVMPGAAPGARGFVGIAFRVNRDASRFEYFYVRPTNGRSDDQVRRNHSLQYAAHPEFPWDVLREKFPGRYESYADVVPGTWIRIRVVIDGVKARLYVNDAEQPSLVVDDLKLGKGAGTIGLWVGPGAIAHFTGLAVTQETLHGDE